MSLLNLLQVADEAEKSALALPEPSQDGRIGTLNSMGGSYKKLPEFTEKFIAFVKNYEKPKILEVGCAYGEGCINLLKQSDVEYTAIDIDERHLRILARRAKEEVPTKLGNLTLLVGKFPDEKVVEMLKDNSFNFILTENVLHFFTPNELYKTFYHFHRVLKPEGRLFSAMSTPYIGIVKPEVIKCFEHQVEKFLLNQNSHSDSDTNIPLFVEDYRSILDSKVLATDEQMDSMLVPKGHGFLFDARIAKYFLERENFLIEKCDYKIIEKELIKLDGRERLEIIAKKPKEMNIPVV